MCVGGDGWGFFQVLTCNLPRGSVIVERPARSEISVSHTALFFHGGSLVFFCLPEVVVTSLMIRRVIRILCSKC